jgi:hypothetical protein
MTTFAQPVVTLAPSAPIVLSVNNDNPSQLSLTTGGSAGAVTSVNGQTGAVTISALVNPMTTLGDTMYGGAAGVVTRLPGDTSNIRKFLRELSVAGVAQVPAWDTLQAADIPSLPYVPTSSLPLAIGSGGTGQITQQAALDALAGAVTPGQVLRGNGTHVLLAALQAGDIPALAQYALLAGATFTGQASPKVTTLAQSGGLVAVNAASGNDFRLTLTASGWTISTPTNPVDGQVIIFVLTQDATGTRTVTWDTGYSFGAGSAPTLSVGANKNDLVGFKYLASIGKWCATGSSLGF